MVSQNWMVAIESAYPNSTDWCSKDIEKSAIPIECLADGVFGPRVLQVFFAKSLMPGLEGARC